jgi:N-acetylglucosamine-6-phosphate deacetylase
MIPKFPNCLWDQLAEDRLSASFIVDGLHLDPSFLRVALRAKSVERTILVTDAAAPAGAVPGRYRLGELDVEMTGDDRVVLAGSQRLAGSALRMNVAVANLMRIGGVSLRDAIRTATVNPARVIGLEGRGEGLKAGDRGDVVVFRVKARVRPQAQPTGHLIQDKADHESSLLVKTTSGTRQGGMAVEAVYLDGVRVA